MEAITVLKVDFSDEAITVYFKDYKSHLAHLAKCAIQNFDESFRQFWGDSVKEVECNSSDLTEEQKAALDQGSVIKFLDDLNEDGSVKRREVEEVKPEKVCFIPMISPKSSSDYGILKLHTGDMADACWDMDPEFLSEIDDNERLDYVDLQYITDKLPNNSPWDIWSHLCHGGTIYIDNKHNRTKLIKAINITK